MAMHACSHRVGESLRWRRRGQGGHTVNPWSARREHDRRGRHGATRRSALHASVRPGPPDALHESRFERGPADASSIGVERLGRGWNRSMTTR